MRMIAALIGLATSFAAVAADVPPQLDAWRAWVLHGEEYRSCPLIAGHAGGEAGDFLCAWPGVLTVQADAGGATIAQRWRIDAEGWVPLPGDAQHWPQQVVVDVEVDPPPAVQDHKRDPRAGRRWRRVRAHDWRWQ